MAKFTCVPLTTVPFLKRKADLFVLFGFGAINAFDLLSSWTCNVDRPLAFVVLNNFELDFLVDL